MDPMTQGAGLQYAPVQHKLTVYDTPSKPQDDPQAKARQAAKDEAAHPFIHYLAQFVPGLVPRPAPALPLPEALDRGDPAGASLLDMPDQEAAKRLGHRGEVKDPGQLALLAVPSFLAPATLPPGPAESTDAEPDLTPVAPAAVPPLVLAQVQRMQAGNATATQIRVQLDPPDLGRLELAFTYAQQKVSVNIVAATAQAKDHLDLQLGAIKSILQDHQLESGTLEVVLGGKTGPQGGSTDREGSGGGTGGNNAPPGQLRRRRSRGGLDEEVSIS